MSARSRAVPCVVIATLLGMASLGAASSLHRGADVQGFRNYRLGPGLRSSPPRTGCGVRDFTRDGHVDLADAAVFQQYFNQSGAADLRPLSRSGNYAYDWDSDRDVDLVDYVWFNECWQGSLSSPVDPTCLAVFDRDNTGQSDGLIDIGDFGGLDDCFSGEGVAPPADCFRAGPGGSAPSSGMFALHGQPVDVLDPDGPSGPQTPLTLQYSRARYFDLKHGRWLQRDPSGYTDGNNLYEAFGGNPVANTDPSGRQTGYEAFNIGAAVRSAFVWQDYLNLDLGSGGRFEAWLDELSRTPRQRFVRVLGGFADVQGQEFHFAPGVDMEFLGRANALAAQGIEFGIGPAESGFRTSMEGYVAFAGFGSVLTSVVPVVPFDWAFDRSLMDLEMNYVVPPALAPVEGWLYRHPGGHLALRVVPDVVWIGAMMPPARLASVPVTEIGGRIRIAPPVLNAEFMSDAAARGLGGFPEWKSGGSITQLTPEGEYPAWFSTLASAKTRTIQGRYWINRARLAETGEFGARQYSKMQVGLAPQQKVLVRNLQTGEIEIKIVSKELHHSLGNRGVPGFDEPVHLREVWPWQHAAMDPRRRIEYEFIEFVGD